jgi:NAD(P)-dependent dehydrogenase (short-subunit alcohol dehydrogenase family)
MEQVKKTVLVTGASSGIGLSVAKVLAAKGHHVYGTSRQCTSGEGTFGFTMVRMDVTVENSVKEAIDFIIDREKRLDVVVNNAGLGMIGPLENTSDEEAREIFETNVFGVMNVCRNTIHHLRNSGGGYIINITSLAAQMGLPFRGIYSSSKFAVEGFTESLSQEVKQFGIKVCLIEPGDFKTNINATRKHASSIDEKHYGDQCRRTLHQVTDEVAKAREPEIIGHCIAGIMSSSSPRLRYRVATTMQRFSLTLMRVLPDRWFEKLVMRHYGL